jgi:two-component system chemotaxis response regulator CheB
VRVLVVDDSAFMRKVISQMIGSERGLEVVGVARNGREGVEMAQKLLPDLITLDIEMPELDGLGALRQIRFKCRGQAPGVLMCSSLTTEGSTEALKALRLGAADVIAKDPATVGQQDQSFRDELIGKLRVIGTERARSRRAVEGQGETHGEGRAGPAAAAARAATPEELRLDQIEAVLVGSSTGGPPALEDIFSLIPASLRVPIFVAQHMPAVFTKSLAGRLAQHCACPVELVTAETAIERPGIYIAEGGRHLHIAPARRGRVTATMSPEPTDAVFRPSVNVLFDSGSAAYQGRVLAVQLTGMGDDGLRGARLLRERGGRILAQHESTCVVYGMPRVIVEAGLADAVMTPIQIGGLLRSLGSNAEPGTGDGAVREPHRKIA